MDSRAIVEKSKALQKAQLAGEPPSVIIGILNDLKKGVSASEEVLRSTKIGVLVAKVKQHKNPEVARLASEIVRKWREEVERQRGGSNARRPAAAAAASSNGASPAASQDRSAAATTAVAAVSTVPPEQRTWKKDKMDVARTSNQSRNNCIGLLYDGIVFKTTAAPAEVLRVAQAVEAAIHAQLGPEEKPTYKAKVRSLFQNLKIKTNDQLRSQVLSGAITPDRFVNMTSAELQSEEQRKTDAKHAKENLRESQVPKEEEVISDMTCGKCGQKKVAYSQKQTRAADEPMTTFCHCLHCGKRWKFC